MDFYIWWGKITDKRLNSVFSFDEHTVNRIAFFKKNLSKSCKRNKTCLMSVDTESTMHASGTAGVHDCKLSAALTTSS